MVRLYDYICEAGILRGNKRSRPVMSFDMDKLLSGGIKGLSDVIRTYGTGIENNDKTAKFNQLISMSMKDATAIYVVYNHMLFVFDPVSETVYNYDFVLNVLETTDYDQEKDSKIYSKINNRFKTVFSDMMEAVGIIVEK